MKGQYLELFLEYRKNLLKNFQLQRQSGKTYLRYARGIA